MEKVDQICSIGRFKELRRMQWMIIDDRLPFPLYALLSAMLLFVLGFLLLALISGKTPYVDLLFIALTAGVFTFLTFSYVKFKNLKKTASENYDQRAQLQLLLYGEIESINTEVDHFGKVTVFTGCQTMHEARKTLLLARIEFYKNVVNKFRVEKFDEVNELLMQYDKTLRCVSCDHCTCGN